MTNTGPKTNLGTIAAVNKLVAVKNHRHIRSIKQRNRNNTADDFLKLLTTSHSTANEQQRRLTTAATYEPPLPFPRLYLPLSVFLPRSVPSPPCLPRSLFLPPLPLPLSGCMIGRSLRSYCYLLLPTTTYYSVMLDPARLGSSTYRIDSGRLGSRTYRIDSTRLDSTRLDSARLRPSTSTRPVSTMDWKLTEEPGSRVKQLSYEANVLLGKVWNVQPWHRVELHASSTKRSYVVGWTGNGCSGLQLQRARQRRHTTPTRKATSAEKIIMTNLTMCERELILFSQRTGWSCDGSPW